MSAEQREALAGFPSTDTIEGWAVGWHPVYPDVLAVACACGHMSVRDRSEIPDHMCPRCRRIRGRQP